LTYSHHVIKDVFEASKNHSPSFLTFDCLFYELLEIQEASNAKQKEMLTFVIRLFEIVVEF
jgi:hypothetical protein